MSSDWPVVCVEDVCELIVDCVNKTAPIVPEVTPYRMIRTTNVRNGRIDISECRYVEKETYEKWTRRAKLEVGDVILTREAPIGEVGFVTEAEGVFLGQRLMQYRADPAKLDSRFLLYSFLSPDLQHQFGSHEGSGSVVSHIRVGDCFKFKLSLPPLKVQQQIGAFLRNIDERIALLRETNVTLEAIAQALFKSWFVDFDPVHANAAAVENKEQAPSLPPEIQALFPATFTDAPQGPIPEGWTVSCFSEICQIASGKRPEIRSDVECEGAKVPLYGGAGVMGYTDKSLFDVKKILTGRVGTLGKVHIATPPFWASDNVLVLTPKDQSNFYFSLNWLLAIDVHSLNRGSTQPLLTQKDLGAQQRALPPNEVLIEFDSLVAELYLKIQANSQQAQTLTTLRDTLLPRLISGKLRLPDAQAILEEDIYAAK